MLTRSGQPNVTGKEVSIPQAVGTIAIMSSFLASMFSIAACFNTASGRYYCNVASDNPSVCGGFYSVSIPQAVGTIAIVD